MSPVSANTRTELKGQEKNIKQYFDDHIELKELNSKSKDFEENEMEISELSDFVSQLDRTREQHMRYMVIGMRACAVIVLFVALCIFKTRNVPNVYTEDFCMNDKGHIILAAPNAELNKNSGMLSFLQLTSSASLDFIFASTIVCFILLGKNGHILHSFGTFYGIRAIIQNIFAMSFPSGGIWEYPGFPSLVIPYGLARDFYFSGHCGFLAINTCYMFDLGRIKTAIAYMIFMPYVIYILLATRIHYTIDIPIGILFGVYVYVFLRPRHR